MTGAVGIIKSKALNSNAFRRHTHCANHAGCLYGFIIRIVCFGSLWHSAFIGIQTSQLIILDLIVVFQILKILERPWCIGTKALFVVLKLHLVGTFIIAHGTELFNRACTVKLILFGTPLLIGHVFGHLKAFPCDGIPRIAFPNAVHIGKMGAGAATAPGVEWGSREPHSVLRPLEHLAVHAAAQFAGVGVKAFHNLVFLNIQLSIAVILGGA